MQNLDSACRCFSASWAESHAHLLGGLEGGPTEDHPPCKPCSPSFPGRTLTRAFLAALALGPFHWIIILPRSSRKMSLLLKLCQESSTCEGQGQGGDRGSCCLDPGKGPQPAPAHVGTAQACHLCAASCVYECGVVCVVYV